MTPTFAGRIQTRLLLAVVVGWPVMALLAALLPHPLASQMGGMSSVPMSKFMTSVAIPSTLGADELMALETVGLMTLLGLAWECIYHTLQLARREGDWPPLFALLAGVPEGMALWGVLHALGIVTGALFVGSSVLPAFAIEFATAWLSAWVAQLSALRVVLPRWRFEGHRVVQRAPT
jgi:hypothetical protein